MGHLQSTAVVSNSLLGQSCSHSTLSSGTEDNPVIQSTAAGQACWQWCDTPGLGIGFAECVRNAALWLCVRFNPGQGLSLGTNFQRFQCYYPLPWTDTCSRTSLTFVCSKIGTRRQRDWMIFSVWCLCLCGSLSFTGKLILGQFLTGLRCASHIAALWTDCVTHSCLSRLLTQNVLQVAPIRVCDLDALLGMASLPWQTRKFNNTFSACSRRFFLWLVAGGKVSRMLVSVDEATGWIQFHKSA